MATCTKCGKINYAGVKNCSACGSPLSSIDDSYDDNYEKDDYETNDYDEEEEIEASDDVSSESDEDDLRPEPSPINSFFNAKNILILVAIIAIVLAIIFIPWKCSSGDVKVKFLPRANETFITDSSITFQDLTEGAKMRHWEFGDGTELTTEEEVAFHTYTEANEDGYWVKLTVDGRYTDSVLVRVKSRIVEDENPDIVQLPSRPRIEGPRVGKTGKPLKFKLLDAENVKEIIWDNGESQVSTTIPEVTLTFNFSGAKRTVSAKVVFNDNTEMKSEPVNIAISNESAPSAGTESASTSTGAEKKTPAPKDEPADWKSCAASQEDISRVAKKIEPMLANNNNSKLAVDFVMSELDGERAKDIVKYNGSKELMNFLDFSKVVQYLQGKPKYKINSMKVECKGKKQRIIEMDISVTE